MIYTHIPYTPKEHGKNLGYAYNKFMEMLPNDDDWACFLDHDAMFTTPTWYNQISAIVEKYSDVGAFGCRTNRVANIYQLVGNIDLMSNSVEYHRNVGRHIQGEYYDDLLEVSEEKKGFSGVFILVSKKTWKTINGFKTKGFTDVDNNLIRRLHKNNIKFSIMNGVYVYHWYRFDNQYRWSRKMLANLQKKYDKDKDNLTLNDIYLFANNGEILE